MYQVAHKHLLVIHGGVVTKTKTESTGLDANEHCVCTCICEDMDAQMIQGEVESNIFARWLFYYPAAMVSNLFYAIVRRR